MKPRPTSEPRSNPGYPSRREFIRQFGVVAATGLGALALPRADAGDLRGTPKPPKAAVPKGKAAFCAKTCTKEIDTQVALLSNDDFKIRKKATAKLIAIGKAEGKGKTVAAKQRQLVLKKMDALKKAKDPEVTQRAKAVILALSPPKKIAVPRQPIEMEGDIVEIFE